MATKFCISSEGEQNTLLTEAAVALDTISWRKQVKGHQLQILEIPWNVKIETHTRVKLNK